MLHGHDSDPLAGEGTGGTVVLAHRWRGGYQKDSSRARHQPVFRPSLFHRGIVSVCSPPCGTALRKGSFSKCRTSPVAVPRRRVWSLPPEERRHVDEAAKPPQQLVVWNGVQNRSLTPWHRLGPLSPTHPQYPYTFKPPIPTDCVGPSHSSCTEECGPDGSFARCGQSRLLICHRPLISTCTSPELLVLPSTKYLRARVNL